MNSDNVIINGGHPLRGKVAIQGSKNASLPILASAVLFQTEVVLHNVPDLLDIRSMLEILQHLGAFCSFESGTVRLDCSRLVNRGIPERLSNLLRASNLLIGSSLSRFGYCEIGMSGGCSIGMRPIDIHLKGFEKLGAEIYIENGVIRVQNNNISGEYTLELPSVGATENLICSSIFNKERVILRNIAKEPEVMDLIHFLQAAGANIVFDDDFSSIIIEGVDRLESVEYQIQPDRIEAGTFLFAAFASKGDIEVVGANPSHLSFVLEKLEEMGAHIEVNGNRIYLAHKGDISGTTVKTAVYPGFPTDLQSQLCVLLTQSDKPSMIVENIFEDRFRYISELTRLNAKIKVEGKVAYIEPTQLSGARIEGYDLRGTASMIIAGLCADGVTRVSGLRHLYRGYEAFIEKLQFLGADICYV